jgi:hypothetical protein
MLRDDDLFGWKDRGTDSHDGWLDTLRTRRGQIIEQACAAQWWWCLGYIDIQKLKGQHRMGRGHEKQEMERDGFRREPVVE